MSNNETTKLEFLLTLSGNIIVQRFFNVRGYNPKVRKSLDLHDNIKKICEENSGKTTGELFSIYSKRGGKKSEKTFKRVLDTLEKKKIITQKMTSEGFRGRSSIIEYKSIEKKITDY